MLRAVILGACLGAAQGLARPSALLGRRAMRLAVPHARVAALQMTSAPEEETEEWVESDFEAEVLKNARVVERFEGEGAWVLVTREFEDDEDECEDIMITERAETIDIQLDDDDDDDDGEEGVVLVQDPTDDNYLLTLFTSEEDATRYLYMLLDEDIDSEATYAAAWYTAADIAELLDDDVKLSVI